MQLPEGATIISSSSDRTHCLVVVGGVHGNEPAGSRAIATATTLIRDGEWTVEGNIFGLVGNPRAVAANTRFVEENLNRAFGRHENPNSYEAKRAEKISTWLAELAEMFDAMYVLDIHSVSVGEARIAIFNAENPRGKSWAEKVSPIPFHLAYKETILPGTLVGAVERLGGTGIAIECGNHSSETGTIVALEHVENWIRELGMSKGTVVSFMGKVMYDGAKRTYTLLATIKPSQGFSFTVPVMSETPIHGGQIFARDDMGEHVAPSDCYLIMPSKDPQPEDYDAGFLATKD